MFYLFLFHWSGWFFPVNLHTWLQVYIRAKNYMLLSFYYFKTKISPRFIVLVGFLKTLKSSKSSHRHWGSSYPWALWESQQGSKFKLLVVHITVCTAERRDGNDWAKLQETRTKIWVAFLCWIDGLFCLGLFLRPLSIPFSCRRSAARRRCYGQALSQRRGYPGSSQAASWAPVISLSHPRIRTLPPIDFHVQPWAFSCRLDHPGRLLRRKALAPGVGPPPHGFDVLVLHGPSVCRRIRCS